MQFARVRSLIILHRNLRENYGVEDLLEILSLLRSANRAVSHFERELLLVQLRGLEALPLIEDLVLDALLPEGKAHQ